MRIPGTSYDLNLEMKNKDSIYLEMEIKKGNESLVKKNILDFDQLKMELHLFIAKNALTVNDKRLGVLFADVGKIFIKLMNDIEKEKKILQMKQSSVNELGKTLELARLNKILVMGLNSAGKTSIYRLLFQGILPYETMKLSPTVGMENHNIDDISTKLYNSNIALWDLGGQESYFSEYFQDPQKYFGNASCLIYVIDATENNSYELTRSFLHRSADLIQKYGTLTTDIHAFCFLNKMDKMNNTDEKFHSLETYFKLDPLNGKQRTDIRFFPTSIYDSSIYNAWSNVFREILPLSLKLNTMAEDLKEDLGLKSIVIVDKRTALPICASKTTMDDSVIGGNCLRLENYISKIAQELALLQIDNITIDSGSGNLLMRNVGKNYLIAALYDNKTEKLFNPEYKNRIELFIQELKEKLD